MSRTMESFAKAKPAKDEDEDFSKAWNHVDRNSGKFVDELIRLARQPSVSAQNLGLKECAELVRSMMESLGIKTEMVSIPDAPQVVYGELRSNEKNARTLVIYNHYDVQPAEPLSGWRTEPFKPQVADGKIYGRGVGDDKGELSSQVLRNSNSS